MTMNTFQIPDFDNKKKSTIVPTVDRKLSTNKKDIAKAGKIVSPSRL